MLGKILGGRYELLKKVGGGGMATVYKAKCHLLNRYVAVKVLRPELVEDDEFVTRFKRESQAAASLSHPNVVNIYDVGQQGDIHYIVMEFVDGKTLKEYINDKGRLDSEEAVKICSHICYALSHAHRNDIVHRDIKPQNILISKELNVKVTDFGIARAVNTATVTMAGSNVIGSVHYFSPEQARGSYVDKQSDVYSLGIVFYEMITGMVPFEGDSAVSVALKHIQNRITPVAEVNPEVPKSIQYIIEKATEKDVNNRYKDTAEFINDLDKALKEPDGSYIKRENVDLSQTTQMVPPYKGEDNRLERRNKKNTESKRKKRNILLTTLSILIVSSLVMLLVAVFSGILKQNSNRGEVEVPEIEGFSIERAERAIDSRNLNMVIAEYRNDDSLEIDHIIYQDLRAGMMVKAGSDVNVIVSLGVERVVVPNTISMSQRSAELELERAGLIVGTPEFVNSEFAMGDVVDQSLIHSTEVEKGTEIILTISMGPQSIGNYIGLAEDEAKRQITDDSFQVGEVNGEYSNEIGPGIVIRQDPLENETSEDDRKVDLWVSMGPNPNKEKQIEIYLEGDIESAQIKVVRVFDSKVMYNDKQSLSEGPTRIAVEGSGKVDYDIYIDEAFWRRETIDFSQEENDN
ncbi:MAG TPA: Stk1 family PASTA domain-containing Ser/Thr kinase [Bacillota bacterium]|nr:Stk1 family PASTA domain-containing Ser/Thr kinase [Bacillota bacterium]